MIRNIKTLGLAFVSVLAMSAAVATAAQATPTIEVSEHVIFIGETSGALHVLASGSRKIECEAAIDGGLHGPVSELTAGPTFPKCTAEIAGKRPATFTPNHCEYVYQNLTTAGTAWTATVDILCENPGEEMEVHVYENETKHKENVSLCTYKVPPHQNIGTVVFSNMPGSEPADLTINMTLSSMQFNASGPVFLCGMSSSNATYNGTFTVRAANTEGQYVPFGVSGE